MNRARPFRLFLAHSFANLSWNDDNKEDPAGISDLHLADLIAKWIHQESNGAIEVVSTRDPLVDYISSKVRQDIASADGVLCLFTKRIQDPVTKLWITSTYVISEASAALMQFESEAESNRRLFGLVEEGVDTSQMGMAFHGNKTAKRFTRMNRDGLRSHVNDIVKSITEKSHRVKLRNDLIYQRLDKVVSVWRNGGVIVETRHQHRASCNKSKIQIPHKIWRVSQQLPLIGELLTGSRTSREGFLRIRPIRCGDRPLGEKDCRIVEVTPSEWTYEREFVVDFGDLTMKSGDVLEYEIAWGYEDAFRSPPTKPETDSYPNSVGLTTNGRGRVGTASLTLRFERDLDGEPDRAMLETPPELSTHDHFVFPAGKTPEKFFHDHEGWQNEGTLDRDPQDSGALFDTYEWSARQFHGMVKVTWTPHLNYFDRERKSTGETANVQTD